MLTLHAETTDDPGFLDVAAQLMTGAAVANGLRDIWVVHIDHWFGERWLGFRGKLLGIAGVHSRSLTRPLVVPPFHPHRVRCVQRFGTNENGDFEPREVGWRTLHGERSSQDNLKKIIHVSGLHAWYSGGTTESGKGAVMVYVVNRGRYAAWYTMFQNEPPWRLVRNVGIARRKVLELTTSDEAGRTS